METSSLTPDDWLDMALVALREEGYAALKAQRLAKRLNVTRGSFYHHFESLDAFHAAVVAHWSRRTTGPVVDRLADCATPVAALRGLLRTTLRSGAAMERAMRSWATVSDRVASEVDKVDRERIGVAEALIEQAGVPSGTARARARLLYWSAIGRLMMPYPDDNRLSDADIDDIAELMLVRP